jgi:hypothetical protein
VPSRDLAGRHRNDDVNAGWGALTRGVGEADAWRLGFAAGLLLLAITHSGPRPEGRGPRRLFRQAAYGLSHAPALNRGAVALLTRDALLVAGPEDQRWQPQKRRVRARRSPPKLQWLSSLPCLLSPLMAADATRARDARSVAERAPTAAAAHSPVRGVRPNALAAPDPKAEGRVVLQLARTSGVVHLVALDVADVRDLRLGSGQLAASIYDVHDPRLGTRVKRGVVS